MIGILKNIRVTLHARTLDILLLGKSRELALALTSLQQGRLLLGEVLKVRGDSTPYPKADDPTSAEVAPAADVSPADYVPTLPEDEIASVEEVRRRLEGTIKELGAERRKIWPRDYGLLEEAVFDRALCELILAKNWLGMQLSELAKPKIVTSRPGPRPSVRPVAKLNPTPAAAAASDQSDPTA